MKKSKYFYCDKIKLKESSKGTLVFSCVPMQWSTGHCRIGFPVFNGKTPTWVRCSMNTGPMLRGPIFLCCLFPFVCFISYFALFPYEPKRNARKKKISIITKRMSYVIKLSVQNRYDLIWVNEYVTKIF